MARRLIGYANPDGSGKGNWSHVDDRIRRLPYTWRQAVRNDDPLAGVHPVRVLAELIAGVVIMTTLFLGFPFLLFVLAAAGGS